MGLGPPCRPQAGGSAVLAASLLVLAGCGSDSDDDADILAGPFADAPAICCPAAADDWPQYRGLTRDGAAAPFAIAPWPESGPTEVWRRPIGDGFASLAIQGDRLYTGATDQREEALFGIDAGTGETLWRLTMGPEFVEEFGDGPRSTPAVDDRGMVYALSSRAVLFAVDGRDGTLIWSHDLFRRFGEGYDRGAFGRGYSSSPLVEGELVVLNVGPRRGGAVVAVDRARGAIVWSSQSGEAAYSSPVAATLGGRRQIVAAIGHGVVGLDPQDGARLWDYPWPTKFELNVAMPVVVPPNRVMLSAGYDQGAVLLEVTTTGGRWSAEPLWTQRLFRNHFNTSVTHDGLLFGFDNARLKCLDAATGDERWAARGFGKGSLVRVGDTLVVLSDDGVLALVRTTGESFQELARAPVLEGTSWTAPAVAGGRLYLRNSNEIVSLELAKPLTP